MFLNRLAWAAARATTMGAPAARRGLKHKGKYVGRKPKSPLPSSKDPKQSSPRSVFVELNSKGDYGRFFHELHERIPSDAGGYYAATMLYLGSLNTVMLNLPEAVSMGMLRAFPGVKAVHNADDVYDPDAAMPTGPPIQ
ncbi:hypothetical protein AURDEDRAFT_175570 [Auricularia subglabra TFB-10046 SS5]|uniref:Uncharacterized protein n=1 Tax=Auricularia subglabra (strain TFB-10046 / SS5) TaxID=717982 RepID=J0D854_AURST|nr:hypothetical protein AURDEDRAFT_175570 [Auricularia subglabra TFB-10046 SS5]